ncbi:MAG: AlpA family phage regulatory protein [Methylococcales bacterium]
MPEMIQKRFIRIGEVITETGIPRSGIYQLIAEGNFPRQVKLGKRSSAWVNTEIADWIDKRIAERDDAEVMR